MPTRREVSFLALGALAAASFRGTAAAASVPPAEDVFLNRLTFGATDQERTSLGALGRAGWLDRQLSMPDRDPDTAGRLAAHRLRIRYDAGSDEHGAWEAVDELRPLAALDADPAALLPLLEWKTPMDFSERARPAEEVIAASLIRAVHAPAQLREAMTQFWHDHFNVDATKDADTAVFFPAYDAMLRRHAFGNFRTLLGEVARAPAMLVYLDNAGSRASPANENFARELLELHTLGAGNYLNDRFPRWSDVPGAAGGLAEGYIDEDVYEVARAFTGWTVGDGRWIGDGEHAPETGRFHYVEAWHDPYQKRVLGREFPPHRGALEDGEEVLDILAVHPGTARLVCTKIARRLFSDEPDAALVERLAAVFLASSDAPDQIGRVVRALALDPAFDAPPGKLRRPFEFLAALYRATGAEVAPPENAHHWQLARAGWKLHGFPAPTGHPDRSEDWQSSTVILRTVDMALYAHDDWFGCTQTPLAAVVPGEVRTFGEAARFWSQRLTGTGDTLGALLEGLGVGSDETLPSEPSERAHVMAMTVAFAALSPSFLYR